MEGIPEVEKILNKKKNTRSRMNTIILNGNIMFTYMKK